MPDDERPIAKEKADAIEAELQASIDDAKADVAADAANAEEKRAAQTRLDNLEQRLATLESRPHVETTPVAEAPASAPASQDGAIAALTEQVSDLAEKIADPVEDVAEAVAGPVGDIAEDAEEIVESVPRRTHSLFKPLFGRRD